MFNKFIPIFICKSLFKNIKLLAIDSINSNIKSPFGYKNINLSKIALIILAICNLEISLSTFNFIIKPFITVIRDSFVNVCALNVSNNKIKLAKSSNIE